MTTTAMTAYTPFKEPFRSDSFERVVEPASVLNPEDAERVARAAAEALAPSSRRAYASALRTYRAALLMREDGGVAALQPEVMFSPQMLASHVTRLAETGSSPSSIETARAATIAAAREYGMAGALRSSEGLRTVMRGVRRTTIRAHSVKRARALTTPEIRRMVAATPDTLAGCRDRAILLVGVSLGLRSSEIVSLTFADINAHEAGYEVVIRSSKTSDRAVNLALPRLHESNATVCAVRALARYVAALRALGEGTDHTSHVFRPVRRGGWTLSGDAMGSESLTPLLQRVAERAGVEPNLTSHSMRATFITRALESGASMLSVAAVSRHSSLQTLRGYDRSSMWQQPASGWLDNV